MHDAPMRERDAQCEWIAGGNALIGEGSDEFSGVNELHVGPSARRALQADVEVHDLKLVLDEWPPGFAVLAAPLDIGECDAVALDEKPRAPVGERVDHWSGPDRIEVELRARAVDVACVKEPQKPIIGAVERAADERGDVGRPQKAAPGELTHDFDVVVSETEGRRLRRTAKPRPAGWGNERLRVHGDIIQARTLPRGCDGWGKGSAIKGRLALLHVGRKTTIYNSLASRVDYGPFSGCS